MSARIATCWSRELTCWTMATAASRGLSNQSPRSSRGWGGYKFPFLVFIKSDTSRLMPRFGSYRLGSHALSTHTRNSQPRDFHVAKTQGRGVPYQSDAGVLFFVLLWALRPLSHDTCWPLLFSSLLFLTIMLRGDDWGIGIQGFGDVCMTEIIWHLQHLT